MCEVTRKKCRSSSAKQWEKSASALGAQPTAGEGVRRGTGPHIAGTMLGRVAVPQLQDRAALCFSSTAHVLCCSSRLKRQQRV